MRRGQLNPGCWDPSGAAQWAPLCTGGEGAHGKREDFPVPGPTPALICPGLTPTGLQRAPTAPPHPGVHANHLKQAKHRRRCLRVGVRARV